MKRETFLVVGLLFCLAFLSSCSNGKKDFLFDDTITWKSTVAEVKAKYGTPDTEEELYMPYYNKKEDKTDSYKATELIYRDFNCCGYDGCYLFIYVDEKNNEIGSISISVPSGKLTEKMSEDIKRALIKKYGEPSGQSDKYMGIEDLTGYRWSDIVKDTFISLSYNKNILNIIYNNANYINELTPIDGYTQTNGI